jgi:beta-mannosidase
MLIFGLLLVGGTGAHGQQVANGLLRVGGFRCANVKSLHNDSGLDLYELGKWSNESLRMDVWKRKGVPFWYPQGTGVVRIAGLAWRPDLGDDISSREAGGRATADTERPADTGFNDSPAGSADHLNDGDNNTYWQAAAGKTEGKLAIVFSSPARVNRIRFLLDDSPGSVPRDYSVGLLLPDGSRKEIASIRGDLRPGDTWREFAGGGVEAKGIYLEIRSTREEKESPIIHEFAAQGEFVAPPVLPQYPTQVTVPMGGYAGDELDFIGNVGAGFPTGPGAETEVGEYVVHYANHEPQVIRLVAGKNVADVQYGHFVPQAEVAFTLRPHDPRAGEGAYHLEQMVSVEAKGQLMMFTHRVAHPEWPIESIDFRCTQANAMLLLAAVTLHQSGPPMNALYYGGKMVKPYPDDTPPAKPSPLEALQDDSREISLNGDWRFATDPGNEGTRKQYFASSYDTSQWKTMPVPSQWYVQGLDYHGVVWFRRELQVPASFPGERTELDFGAVDYEARVWVNGIYVGRHIGAYTSFHLDVSSAIRKGERNLIVVRVDCPLDPGYPEQKTLIKGNSADDLIMPYDQEGSMGGIYRTVKLRGRGDVAISEPWAVTRLSADLQHADLQVKLLLESQAQAGRAEVTANLIEPERPGASSRNFTSTMPFTLQARQIPLELQIPIDNPLLWYPWEQGTPYLHTLEITVRRNGELLDRQVMLVGLRQIEFNQREHYLLVNHHRMFLKGMVNDDVHWRSLMDRRGYTQRIKMQKDANLNIVRLIAHQAPPELYDLCDEMGMLIWQEMPLQWGYSHTETIRRDALDVVRETMVQTRQHASVAGWSAWNEGGQEEFSARVTALMDQMDGTRPLSRASGNGDFDVHIYPTSDDTISRRTPLWIGLKLGFVSETGSYGMASLENLKEMAGDHFLQFGSAESLWGNLSTFRRQDSPLFLDIPAAVEWQTEKIGQYIRSKIPVSTRYIAQYSQSFYENARAQRFAPSTAAIDCRFDDAYPLGYSGAAVTFTGRPKSAYRAIQMANQPVLPILFLNYTGVEDIRVVNEYWFRSWKNLTLTYRLRSHDGRMLKDLTRTLDLPPDSTVPVLSGQEAGDVWHVPGGFVADLSIRDAAGKILSENHYDYTEEEIQRFWTSVYPPAPIPPVDAIVLRAEEATAAASISKQSSDHGTYSKTLLQFGSGDAGSQVEFTADLPQDSDYFIRLSANSGKAARMLELEIDGARAPLEDYAGLDATQPITREVHPEPEFSWFPGWRMRLSKGKHHLVLSLPASKNVPTLILDSVALQPYKELPDPNVIPRLAASAE